MKKYRNKTHIGEIAIVTYTGSSHRRHQIATEKSKLCIGVKILQRLHQMRCVKVTRGFANYEVIFHNGQALSWSKTE